MSETPAAGFSSLAEYGLNREQSGDDVAVPFTLDELNCRGRSVRLAGALQQILSAHKYPGPVARVLGEAVVLCTLMGSSLKFAGRFILQAQTDGPVNMIVVDLDAADSAGASHGLRAYARYDENAIKALDKIDKIKTAQLLGKGHLAMTVDQGAHTERYQGIVEIDGGGFETAAHQYFMQSEQIPTRVRLAVGEHKVRGDKTSNWRAGGMMVQYLPKAKISEDLPGGDEPDQTGSGFKETEEWVETKSLFSTISDDELLDPQVSIERLLFRLFNEKGVTVFDPQPLSARCTCSAQRSEEMLQNSFSHDERKEMAIDGEIEIVCEFCSTAYHFNPNQFTMDK